MQNERYSRQIILPEFGGEAQKKLLQASILTVGAGGLAASALPYLAASGIGKIGICDGDKVSISNLSRQILFSESDLGLNKAEIAAKKLRELNPDVNVKYYPFFIEENNVLSLLSEYDLILDCTDNFDTRYLLNDAACMKQKPVVYAAVDGTEGQVSVFNVKNEDGTFSVNLRDVFPNAPEQSAVKNCAENGVLSVAAGIIGLMQAAEVVKLISGKGEILKNKMMIYNVLKNSSYILHFPERTAQQVPAFLSKTQRNTCSILFETVYFDEKNRLPANCSVYDVRERGEYEQKNFGFENLPLSEIKAGKLPAFNSTCLAFHCKSGFRSEQAIRILSEKLPEKKFFNLIFRKNEWL
jgi:adenylyltransferase/sulfurtransferase